MNLAYLLSTVISIIGIFLLILTYTYIDKLEKTGCDCSVHPYKKYIKGYSVFAIIYIFFMFLLPMPAIIIKAFGKQSAGIFWLAHILFVILTIVFFVYSLIYTRYLMKEKCKCSEDVRREILYLWSLLEVILFALLFIIQILVLLAAVSIGAAVGMVDIVSSNGKIVEEAVMNPVKSVKRIPGAVRNIPNEFKKFKKFSKR